MKELKDNDAILNKLVLKVDPEYCHNKFLGTFTKEELNNMRKELSLKGVSSLSKTELVDCISNKIKDEANSIIHQLTHREFCYLERLYKSKSHLKIKNSDIRVLWSLRNQGIAFGVVDGEERTAIIPKDLIESIKKSMQDKYLKEYISYRDRIGDVLIGMLNYYGVMKYNVAYEHLVKITGQYFDQEYFNEILMIIVRCQYIKYENDVIYLKDVIDPINILNEQAKVAQIPFFNITIQDAINVAERKNKWGKHEEKLYSYIVDRYNCDSNDATKIVDKCVSMIKNEIHIDEVILEIKNEIAHDVNGVNDELIALIRDINENTIRWSFKGYSINDIRRIYIHTGDNIKKYTNVSRNDLCPCGSGKKSIKNVAEDRNK